MTGSDYINAAAILFGVVGTLTGVWVGYALGRKKDKEDRTLRILAAWEAISAEVESCAGLATEFVHGRDGVRVTSPQWRLSSAVYKASLPALLSDAAIEADTASGLLQFYVEVESLNRGLDWRQELGPGAGDEKAKARRDDVNLIKARKIARDGEYYTKLRAMLDAFVRRESQLAHMAQNETPPPAGKGTSTTVPLDGVSGTGAIGGLAASSTSPSMSHLSSPGGTSRADRQPDGTVRLEWEGSEGGEKGEPWVFQTLCEALRDAGFQVVVQLRRDATEDRTRNQSGEDRNIMLNGTPLAVQMTTAAPEDMHAEAKKGQSLRSPTASDHVQWIREAIERKQFLDASFKRKLILAIDARHAGIINVHETAALYVSRHGNPAVECGFHSVWIIGPTKQQSYRLG